MQDAHSETAEDTACPISAAAAFAAVATVAGEG
jgi:hypothetical protein